MISNEELNVSTIEATKNLINEEKPSVAEFYRGKCIFLTGASGFVGKSVILKLLKDCADLDTIYLLMRQKRGKLPEQRLRELINSRIFENLKAERGETALLKKLKVIEGDITVLGLGLAENDREELCKRIHVIFHVAATVKFDEPLKVAVITNTRATREVIALAKDMTNLKALVHTSTLFSNSLQEEIKEEVYPTTIDPEKLIHCAEWMDETLMDFMTPVLLGKRPNTYVYTKHLAEKLMYDASKTIPAAIFRPSIIMSTMNEPFPGWVENLNGPAGIAASGGLCMLGNMLCHREKTAEICPVDGCANFLIAVAWYLANFRPNTCPVFNYSATKGDGPLWQVFEDQFHNLYRKLPFTKALGTPTFTLTHSYLKMHISQGYFLLYAYIVDFIQGLMGNKKRLVCVQKRIKSAAWSLEHFVIHEWTAETSNVYRLLNTLHLKDAITFNFSLKNRNWDEYVYNFTHGVRKYVLKDDDNTAPAAGKRIKRLRWIHGSFLILFLGILYYSILSPLIPNFVNHNYNFKENLFTLQ